MLRSTSCSTRRETSRRVSATSNAGAGWAPAPERPCELRKSRPGPPREEVCSDAVTSLPAALLAGRRLRGDARAFGGAARAGLSAGRPFPFEREQRGAERPRGAPRAGRRSAARGRR